jgi:hypothetical protein
VPGGSGDSWNKSNPAAAGNGKAPVCYHKHWQPVKISYSSARICLASQQAERYEAGYDVSSELASHDACVLLLIDHLTGGLINVLVFVALRFDTSYHYSAASSHQQRFGSD